MGTQAHRGAARDDLLARFHRRSPVGSRPRRLRVSAERRPFRAPLPVRAAKGFAGPLRRRLRGRRARPPPRSSARGFPGACRRRAREAARALPAGARRVRARRVPARRRLLGLDLRSLSPRSRGFPLHQLFLDAAVHVSGPVHPRRRRPPIAARALLSRGLDGLRRVPGRAPSPPAKPSARAHRARHLHERADDRPRQRGVDSGRQRHPVPVDAFLPGSGNDDLRIRRPDHRALRRQSEAADRGRRGGGADADHRQRHRRRAVPAPAGEAVRWPASRDRLHRPRRSDQGREDVHPGDEGDRRRAPRGGRLDRRPHLRGRGVRHRMPPARVRAGPRPQRQVPRLPRARGDPPAARSSRADLDERGASPGRARGLRQRSSGAHHRRGRLPRDGGRAHARGSSARICRRRGPHRRARADGARGACPARRSRALAQGAARIAFHAAFVARDVALS